MPNPENPSSGEGSDFREELSQVREGLDRARRLRQKLINQTMRPRPASEDMDVRAAEHGVFN